MTNKDFKEWMEVDCELNDKKVYGAKLHKCGGNWYIYATRNGIAQSWHIGDGSNLSQHGVTNLQPKFRTIDDLECGDIIADGSGWKRKCLGKCGEVYAISNNGNKTIDNADKIYSSGWTIYQLKKCGYTLYQPTEETDIDKCIKVVEKYFEKLVKPVEYSDIVQDGIIQALKNFKNKN